MAEGPAAPASEHQTFDLTVDPRSPKVLYASALGLGIFRSTDGARSWSALGRPGPNTTAIEHDPFTPRRLYAGLSSQIIPVSGVFRSDDGGESWEEVSAGLPASEVFALQGDGGRVYAATANGVWALEEE